MSRRAGTERPANAPALGDSFTTTVTFDALNRPVSTTFPDALAAGTYAGGTVETRTYDDGGRLYSITSNPGGTSTGIAAITYNARGQRSLLVSRAAASASAPVVTQYDYDPQTFRLAALRTSTGIYVPPNPQNNTAPTALQDLTYTYDPVGNIVEIDDAAQQTYYFANTISAPSFLYTYDALYRLKSAVGREHASQTADQDQIGAVVAITDNQAIRPYSELYTYDEAGNILTVQHVAPTPQGTTIAANSWTRSYQYAYASPVQSQAPPPPLGNRLVATSILGDAAGHYSAEYPHDARGNMTAMPHLPNMQWDFRDRLQSVQTQAFANVQNPYPDTGIAPDTAVRDGTVTFHYDASGQRVRKTWVHGQYRDERIYLGACEFFRRRASSTPTATTAAPDDETRSIHLLDNHRRIALVETVTLTSNPTTSPLGPVVRYQLDNHLQSSCLELSATASVLTYEEYHPYGTTALYFQNGTVSLKRYRYTGKERDEETGFSYHGARYLAVWLGRWVSADPATHYEASHFLESTRGKAVLDWNAYSSCNNSPVIYRDLDGKEPTKEKVGTLKNLIEHVSRLESQFQAQGLTLREANERILPPHPNAESYRVFNELRNVDHSGKHLRLDRPVADRYIYTERGGWIDLTHFSAAAGGTAGHSILRRLPGVGYFAEREGRKTEEQQAGSEKAGVRASAYSYEDLPSNRFGFLFGKNADLDRPLGPQLEAFFRKVLGGDVDPRKVGNWAEIANWDTDTIGKEPLHNRTSDPILFPVNPKGGKDSEHAEHRHGNTHKSNHHTTKHTHTSRSP